MSKKISFEEDVKKTLAPGSGVSYTQFDEPDYRILQLFDAPEGRYKVSFHTAEMTALCPLTGQPDWYDTTVTYIPNTKCIESKSAKHYFGSFRNKGAFIETVAKIVIDDWVKACKPQYVKVDITMNSRGGVGMTVVREYGFVEEDSAL